MLTSPRGLLLIAVFWLLLSPQAQANIVGRWTFQWPELQALVVTYRAWTADEGKMLTDLKNYEVAIGEDQDSYVVQIVCSNQSYPACRNSTYRVGSGMSADQIPSGGSLTLMTSRQIPGEVAATFIGALELRETLPVAGRPELSDKAQATADLEDRYYVAVVDWSKLQPPTRPIPIVLPPCYGEELYRVNPDTFAASRMSSCFE